MDKIEIQRVVQEKLTELRALQSEAQAGCETVALDQTCVGRLSRMDAMQSQAMNQAAQQRRILEITRLQGTLARMQDADFGACLSCDEMISQGRLLLDPAAQYCIACAQKLENA